MTTLINKIIKILFLLVFALSYSQNKKKDSLRGSFTYLLRSKPNNLNKNFIYKELFSMQVSNEEAYYISENKLKFDSVFTTSFQNGNTSIDLQSVSRKPTTNYLIIQRNDSIQFYSTIGMTLLSYKSPVIVDWKLNNETMIINNLRCKKATVSYKGRNWIAWYSIDIPFPYGPYKFSGLPGLIVKITDEKGDYDFELVKSIASSNLKGKTVIISDIHFKNAKLVTKKQLITARDNFKNNAKQELESMGTVFFNDKKERKTDMYDEKKAYNPLELED